MAAGDLPRPMSSPTVGTEEVKLNVEGLVRSLGYGDVLDQHGVKCFHNLPSYASDASTASGVYRRPALKTSRLRSRNQTFPATSWRGTIPLNGLVQAHFAFCVLDSGNCESDPNPLDKSAFTTSRLQNREIIINTLNTYNTHTYTKILTFDHPQRKTQEG